MDIIEGRSSIEQTVLKDDEIEGLYLLPASQTREKVDIMPETMIQLCDELKKTFDFILIDCPAGIEQGFKNAIAAANTAFVVTTADIAAARDADRVIGLLEKSNVRQILLIINRIRSDLIKKGEMVNLDNVIETLGVDTIGLVPEDDYVIISNANGRLVINQPRSMAGKTYQNIARRICGEKVPIVNLDKRRGLRRLFGRQ